MSSVREVRGGCPEGVIIGLDLRRNKDYVSGSWKKCFGQGEQHGQRPHGPWSNRQANSPVRLGWMEQRQGGAKLGGWAKWVRRDPLGNPSLGSGR